MMSALQVLFGLLGLAIFVLFMIVLFGEDEEYPDDEDNNER